MVEGEIWAKNNSYLFPKKNIGVVFWRSYVKSDTRVAVIFH